MGKSKILYVPVKGVYFDQIKAGTKTKEYRLMTSFWSKRLLGRSYTSILLTKGYPKTEDTARRLELPYRGFNIELINHPEFGPDRVRVFAIYVDRFRPQSPNLKLADSGTISAGDDGRRSPPQLGVLPT